MSLKGSLAVPNLSGLIQLVSLERLVARLRVQQGARAGCLYFADGAVVHAEFEGLEGEPAFQSILNLEGGAFELEPNVPSPRQTLDRPVEALLLDACRRRDEVDRAHNNGLGTLTKAVIEPGLARGLLLVEPDGCILFQHNLPDAERYAAAIARLDHEGKQIGGLLKLGDLRRGRIQSSDGGSLVLLRYNDRWVGVKAAPGMARRLDAALDHIAAGGPEPAVES
jgi:hypothetical protein